jgi:hypothetical protein
MSLDVDADTERRSGDLTLVFSLGAAGRLADPSAAFDEARRWSRYVGVVANDAAAVERFVSEHGVANDYALRNWDKWGTLGDIYTEADTPRHVFVGTSSSDRRVATHVGFEYRPIGEAAEKAEWALADPDAATDPGAVERLRRAVRDWLG